MSDTDQKLSMAFELLREAEDKLSSVRQLLESGADISGVHNKNKQASRVPRPLAASGESMRIVKGVFDGQSMLGEDKKIYPVPANYASKSKLVEGDSLKLTVALDGSFIFKQISPVERKHVCGVLSHDEQGECFVKVGHKDYRVLMASVTFFKGLPGDEVTLIVPSSGRANWGAIENIIKKTGSPNADRELQNRVRQVEQETTNEMEINDKYNKTEEQTIPIEGASGPEKNPAGTEE